MRSARQAASHPVALAFPPLLSEASPLHELLERSYAGPTDRSALIFLAKYSARAHPSAAPTAEAQRVASPQNALERTSQTFQA